MSFWTIFLNIVLSLLASFMFWMLTFVVTQTKIIFSTVIE